MSVLVRDQRLCIADHNDDHIGIKLPEAYGLAIVGPGQSDRIYYHPISGPEGPFRDDSCGWYWAGEAGGDGDPHIMVLFPGAYGHFDLQLCGRYCRTTGDDSDTEAAIAGNRADYGLMIRNTATSPPGAKSIVTLSGQLFEESLVGFDYVGEENHADSVLFPFLCHRWCRRQIHVLNNQSTHITVMLSKHDGSPCEAMWDFEKCGDFKVFSGYAANGTSLRIGPTVASTGANYEVDLKLDANFGLSNVRLLECYATGQWARVRMKGSLGYNTPPNKQLILRHEGLGDQSDAQADIQVDIKGLSRTEAAAYPHRPVRGWHFDTTQEFPTTAFVDSTKLWIDPTTTTGYTFSGNGENNDTISVVADRSGVQTSLAGQGTNPTYRKPGINWRPVIQGYISGGGERRLVKTSPVSLGDGPSALTIMAVYQEQQGTYGVDCAICSCRNANGTGGFDLYREALSGLVKFKVGGVTLTSDEAITDGKPMLIIAQWIGADQSMTLWVDGVKATGSPSATPPSSLSAVDGHLVVGGWQTAATPTYGAHLTGRLGELFIDEADWDISATDTGANYAPLIGIWSAEARERINYLRAKWGVF